MRPVVGRAALVLAAVVVAASLVVGLSTGRTGDVVAACAAVGSVAVGAVILARRPSSAVGPALAWCGAAPLLVVLAGQYGATADAGDPWPGAHAVAAVAVGLWPLNVAGLVALLLVFPDGPRPGLLWRAPGVLLALATSATVFALWDARQIDGRLVGAPESWLRSGVAALGILLVAISLGIGVAAIVKASRAGGERRRLQVRWLSLAGVVATALLAAGWVAETLGAPLALAYTPHLLAIVVLVPVAVAVAILRHDLFDVDRVLGDTVSVVVTALASAAVFGAVVLGASRVLGVAGEVPTVTAAFVTALLLLPLHQHIARTLGRVLDRDRYVAVAAVERFVSDVRLGRRQPEEVQDVLRASQGDSGLVLALRRPDGTWTDLTGDKVDLTAAIDITSSGEPVARITLGYDTARARRRVADLAAAAWLPIEVSRLRLGLREAVAEVEASRWRLAEAVAHERHRLERDLHDGAQQSIVATGMRLRRLQRSLNGEQADEVDLAVSDLETTVRELRALAHGVRPARLDDGLGPALEAVRAASPVPVTLHVEALPLADETRTATAYLVVSEAVTNALKHACAAHIDVSVAPSGDRMAIEVRDDGVGGAPDHGPLALKDRVASVGGALSVESPPGVGTTVRALV